MPEQEEFSQFVLDGWTIKELQEHYGISRSAVSSYKLKWNLVGKSPNLGGRTRTSEIKRCNTCLEDKNLSEFYTNGTSVKGTVTYRPECKACGPKSRYEFYDRKILEILEELGLEYKCMSCGYDKNTAALTFHHRDPNTKLFSIGSNKSRSKEDFKNEIKKCDVLCQNCHMEEHYPHLTK